MNPNKSVLVIGGVLLSLALGCEHQADEEEGWVAFREAHVLRGPEGSTESFLIEGDIVVGESALREYYDAFVRERGEDHAVEDGVGIATSELVADAPFGVVSKRGGATIDYCYDDDWGIATGNIFDGFYTSPSLAPVMAAIDQAAEIWNRTADTKFRHRRDLDGSGCNNGLRWSGQIEFWVTHYNNATTAQGAVPSAGNDQQWLRVPTSGISVPLALHELGHVLGFRHEHMRSGGGLPYCYEPGQVIGLTAVDAVSVMAYANCSVNNNIIGRFAPSALDGVGARSVYGNPDWWVAGPWL